MKSADIPIDESARLAALKRYELLDTHPEQSFDDLALLASTICDTPIALISLIDVDRQWFKARVGLDATETHRDLAFCAHAIHGDKVFVVEDTALDDRFADNPLVSNDPKIRFYMGAPLITHDGFALGTLCVIDKIPRKLSVEKTESLEALARLAVDQFELRVLNRNLKQANANKVHLFSTIAHDLRTPFQNLLGYAKMCDEKMLTMPPARVKAIGAGLNNAARQAFDLLDNLLNWSRSQLDAIEIKKESVNLKMVCQDIVLFHEAKIEKKEIHVNVDVKYNVLSDKQILNTVIQNLFANALKFTDHNGKVDLFAKKQNGLVAIFVSDTGVGMPEESVAQFNGRSLLSSHVGTDGEMGTGLGLMLCVEYLRRMDSRLHLESSEGKGTTFWFELPEASDS